VPRTSEAIAPCVIQWNKPPTAFVPAPMSRKERILYQFPISHYCEKTRWNLDAKGLPYVVRNLPPGVHLLVVKRLLGKGKLTVPVLVDRGQAVGDSAAIAAHLEQAYPERLLLPKGEADRARALELEAYFGKNAGRAVRQWLYGQLVQREGSAVAVMLEEYSAPVRLLGRVMAKRIEGVLRKQYHLDPEGIAAARATIIEVFERIELETQSDPTRYLVGGAISIADITAASLLAPLVTPPGSPWDSKEGQARETEAMRALRAELSTRPGWAWVLARYAHDRR
jgi:glutathione S-transferase